MKTSSKSTVLIVDENKDYRTLIEGYLKSYSGLQVEVADNAFDALLQIIRKPPQILISEFELSGSSGEDLLKIAKIRSPSTIVILLFSTSSIAHATYEQLNKLGVDLLASKFNLNETLFTFLQAGFQ